MARAYPHEYLVGLPVLVTVYADGTVEYTVDTTEASVAIREEEPSPYVDQLDNVEYLEEEIEADAKVIDADHERRRVLNDPAFEAEEWLRDLHDLVERIKTADGDIAKVMAGKEAFLSAKSLVQAHPGIANQAFPLVLAIYAYGFDFNAEQVSTLVTNKIDEWKGV